MGADKMEKDIILLRLVNNDRIIGQILRMDREIMAIYAPMLVDLDYEAGSFQYILSPYDPLSDTVMAIIDTENILTITMPRKDLLEEYESCWKEFYPTLVEMQKKMLEDAKKKYGEDLLDPGKLSDMFSDLMSNSLPLDKKKLN